MTDHIRRHSRWYFKLSLATALVLVAAVYEMSAQAAVEVTGVAAYHSSVKIFYRPVPGAQDYRVYDLANPTAVKYAGWAHLTASPTCPGSGCFHHFVTQSDGTVVFPYQVASGSTGGPQVLDVPATVIDWNNVGDGQPHTLVVEAVDALGPIPKGSLYTGENNDPLVNPLPVGAMLGMNKGPTEDGKNSTNGQGPYTNNPSVIARSQPFVVHVNRNFVSIPSKSTSTQRFLDTFDNSQASSLTLLARNDGATDQFGNLGIMTFSLNSGTPKAWEIEYRQADNRNSMPFISADHFMDMIFSGATPGVSASTHTLYGSMAMSPLQTFEITGGKIAHLTMEVDAHQSFRRWMDIQITPAGDPLRGWDPSNHQINTSGRAMFLEIRDGGCTLDIFTGPTSASDPRPTGTAGGSHGARLWGPSGAFGGGAVLCGWDQMYVNRNFSKNGYGLDDKSRYDLFISQTHAAFFQDGQLLIESPIPAGTFPWADGPLRATYSHYLYHSTNDVEELKNVNVNGQMMCYPLNSFWFNNPITGTAANQNVCNRAYPPGYGFPHSDERHWDNMGFEVLPASEANGSSFSALAALVQHPVPQPPQYSTSLLPRMPTNLRILN